MHPEIVKKMNEIIAILKIIERETAGYGSINDRMSIGNQRAPEVKAKVDQLNFLLALHGKDETSDRLYKQLIQDIDNTLDIRDPPRFRSEF